MRDDVCFVCCLQSVCRKLWQCCAKNVLWTWSFMVQWIQHKVNRTGGRKAGLFVLVGEESLDHDLLLWNPRLLSVSSPHHSRTVKNLGSFQGNECKIKWTRAHLKVWTILCILLSRVYGGCICGWVLDWHFQWQLVTGKGFSHLSMHESRVESDRSERVLKKGIWLSIQPLWIVLFVVFSKWCCLQLEP